MHTYGRFPVVIDHGKGATLWDAEGKKYIDLTSGIGVCSLGHGNPALTEAIAAQETYLRDLVKHTNPYTGLAYKDDPSIVGFEINNEPAIPVRKKK